MTKKIIAVAALSVATLLIGHSLQAQNAITQEGEFGFGIGAGHYFGDLNTRSRLNRAKIAGTIFFRKNLGNYIAVRLGATFAQLGYSDVYNTHNTYMNSRNLSFNTKVWELTLQGDFNFFRFMPGSLNIVLLHILLWEAGYSVSTLMHTCAEKKFNSGH